MACATLLHLFMALILLDYCFILESLPSIPLLEGQVERERELEAKSLSNQAYQIHPLRISQVTVNWTVRRKIKVQRIHNNESPVLKLSISEMINSVLIFHFPK